MGKTNKEVAIVTINHLNLKAPFKVGMYNFKRKLTKRSEMVCFSLFDGFRKIEDMTGT